MTLVSDVLDYVDAHYAGGGASYGTRSYGAAGYGATAVVTPAKPLLVNRDTPLRRDTRERTKNVDLAAIPQPGVVGVSSTPVTEFRPAGFGYLTERVDEAVSVRVEAADASEFGGVRDAAQFDALASEVRRAINVERDQASTGRLWLKVTEADDLSHLYADAYRRDFTVAAARYDDLP
jgi:hypothetical protein